MKMEIPVSPRTAGDARRTARGRGPVVARQVGRRCRTEQRSCASGRRELRNSRFAGAGARWAARRWSRASRAGPPHHPRAHRWPGRRRLVPGSGPPHRAGPIRGRQARRRDAGALRHGAGEDRRPARSRSAARISPIRGGTSWSGDRKKGGQGGFVEDLAHEYRIPLVNLIDGAGGSVTSIQRRGHSVFPGVHGFERRCG